MEKSYFDVMRTGLDLAYSVILVTTCVYNYLIAPDVVCLLVKCNGSVTTTVKSMFPRSLAIVCFVSRITAMYKNVSDLPKYRDKIHEYDLNFPIDFSTRNVRRLFTAVIVLAYVVIILPLNVSRVYLIYDNFRDIRMMLFFVIMYAHNWSICLTEIQFVIRCFGLYQKFRSVNKDMAAVMSEIIIANKYPAALCVTGSEPRRRGQTTANDGDPRPQMPINARRVTVNKIELFRMRYQFVRRTLNTLNRLHGIQLGLSICILFTLALFDIYGEKYTINHKTRSKIFIYGWLFQYSFRFCAIILTTHITTKQAHKTKKLITDINNRHLDDNTKEEAIVAGTSYLIILLQFDGTSEEDN